MKMQRRPRRQKKLAKAVAASLCAREAFLMTSSDLLTVHA